VSSRPLTIEQVLAMLAEHPRRIAALTGGLTSAQLHSAPGPGEWSANDVLAHLRSCADVWGSYMMTILAEDRPTIRAVSPRTWIKKTDYPAQEFATALRSFTAQRAELLAVLEPLPPPGWSRPATVSAVGRVYERTVLDYAERLVRHEQEHVRQIERIVGRHGSSQDRNE
jgi:hypothetical protein